MRGAEGAGIVFLWVCRFGICGGRNMTGTFELILDQLTNILEEDFCKFTNYSYVKKILIACNFASTPSHLSAYLCSLTE